MFSIWSLAFWYGSQQVADGYCDFTDMFKVSVDSGPVYD